jgi:hypothetical protein
MARTKYSGKRRSSYVSSDNGNTTVKERKSREEVYSKSDRMITSAESTPEFKIED